MPTSGSLGSSRKRASQPERQLRPAPSRLPSLNRANVAGPHWRVTTSAATRTRPQCTAGPQGEMALSSGPNRPDRAQHRRGPEGTAVRLHRCEGITRPARLRWSLKRPSTSLTGPSHRLNRPGRMAVFVPHRAPRRGRRGQPMMWSISGWVRPAAEEGEGALHARLRGRRGHVEADSKGVGDHLFRIEVDSVELTPTRRNGAVGFRET